MILTGFWEVIPRTNPAEPTLWWPFLGMGGLWSTDRKSHTRYALRNLYAYTWFYVVLAGLKWLTKVYAKWWAYIRIITAPRDNPIPKKRIRATTTNHPPTQVLNYKGVAPVFKFAYDQQQSLGYLLPSESWLASRRRKIFLNQPEQRAAGASMSWLRIPQTSEKPMIFMPVSRLVCVFSQACFSGKRRINEKVVLFNFWGLSDPMLNRRLSFSDNA